MSLVTRQLAAAITVMGVNACAGRWQTGLGDSALISAGGGNGTDNLWSGTVVAHDSAAAVKVADGVGKRVGGNRFCAG